MASDERLIQAVQRATRKLASSGNFNVLMYDVLAICVEAVGASGGSIYLHDAAAERLQFQHVLPEDVADRLPSKDIPDDFGMAGEAFQKRQTVSREFPEKPDSDWNAFEKATGVAVRSMIATPLMIEDEAPIGVVQLINKKEGDFSSSDNAVLDIVSSVSTMAYLNFRLTEESARASTLLGMGKVSHDIGNLAAALYANLNVGELALDGLKKGANKHVKDTSLNLCVDTLGPVFEDLKESVDRIVGYSRLVSDMSAGRPLRPTKKLATMAATIQASAAYIETEGRASHVAMRYDIDADAPPTMFDELYIFRIVQNLVGNAVKAVKEIVPDDWHEPDISEFEPAVFGEVLVRYCFDGASHTIEVQDSGAGMTQETINRILSGNARSQWDKAGGSGWGLKIVLELTAAHDGTVSISSKPGQGTSFRIVIPHCPG